MVSSRLHLVRVSNHLAFDRVQLGITGGLPNWSVDAKVPNTDGSTVVVTLSGTEPASDLTLRTARPVNVLRGITPEQAGKSTSVALPLRAWHGARVTRGTNAILIDIAHAEMEEDEVLRLGDRAPAVATWQWRLTKRLQSIVPVDGHFGPATHQATKEASGSQGRVDADAWSNMEHAVGIRDAKDILTRDQVLETAEGLRRAAADGDRATMDAMLRQVLVNLGFNIIRFSKHRRDADEHRRLGIPFILEEHLYELATTMLNGRLVKAGSVIDRLQASGAHPVDRPDLALPRDFVTDYLVGVMDNRTVFDRHNAVPALIAAATTVRVAGTIPAIPGSFRDVDDGLLDALQLFLLMWAIRGAAAGRSDA
jgi:peptidoglycan hydrolase-like protein with peptidoglycan-binding domain